jgi:hypothetical protein
VFRHVSVAHSNDKSSILRTAEAGGGICWLIEVTHTFGFFYRLFPNKNTQRLDEIQKLLNTFC